MHERRHVGLCSLHRPGLISILLLLSLSLSLSIALSSIQVTPTINYDTKPKFADHCRTNEAAASRTNARLCAPFVENLFFSCGTPAHDRRDIWWRSNVTILSVTTRWLIKTGGFSYSKTGWVYFLNVCYMIFVVLSPSISVLNYLTFSF